MPRLLAALLALAWLPNATAGQIYKCIDAAGHKSVQSVPCAAEQKTEWARDVASNPSPAASAVAPRRPAPSSNAPHAPTTGWITPTKGPEGYVPPAPDNLTTPEASDRDRQRNACRYAREREATYRSTHPEAKYDALTEVHDRTSAACQGL